MGALSQELWLSGILASVGGVFETSSDFYFIIRMLIVVVRLRFMLLKLYQMFWDHWLMIRAFS
jgi:hypothetical protein